MGNRCYTTTKHVHLERHHQPGHLRISPGSMKSSRKQSINLETIIQRFAEQMLLLPSAGKQKCSWLLWWNPAFTSYKWLLSYDTETWTKGVILLCNNNCGFHLFVKATFLSTWDTLKSESWEWISTGRLLHLAVGERLVGSRFKQDMCLARKREPALVLKGQVFKLSSWSPQLFWLNYMHTQTYTHTATSFRPWWMSAHNIAVTETMDSDITSLCVAEMFSSTISIISLHKLNCLT